MGGRTGEGSTGGGVRGGGGAHVCSMTDITI